MLWATYVGSDTSGAIADNDATTYEEHDASPSVNDLPNVVTGTYLHIPGQDTAYVNFSGGPEPDVPAYVAVRKTLRIRTSNVKVIGFAIEHSSAHGIAIGTQGHIRNVTIANNDIHNSTDRGIDVRTSIQGSIINNTVGQNGHHGIYLVSTDVADYLVSGNTSSNNWNPGPDDIANGIRVGDKNYTGADTATVGNHIIENNIMFGNRDSGIEIHGSHGVVCRNNRAFNNGDHGFDHLYARSTTHTGDLAYGNYTDGISVEPGCSGTVIRNCIMVDNGQNPDDLDPELEAPEGARWGFVADNNLYFRSVASDSVLIDFEGGNQGVGSYCNDTTKCFRSIAQMRRHFAAFEAHGKQGDPHFVDSESADYRLKTDSPGVDAADTTASGWAATDALGVARYDCRLVSNTGIPSGTFGDIGPIEHDDGAPVIDAVVDYNTADITWVARGATGDVSPAPVRHEVYVNDVKKNVNAAPAPGNVVEEIVSLSLCAESSVYVITVDSDSLRAKSNTLSLETCCGQGCYGTGPGGGGGESARHTREGGAEYRLDLGRPLPNPTAGALR